MSDCEGSAFVWIYPFIDFSLKDYRKVVKLWKVGPGGK